MSPDVAELRARLPRLMLRDEGRLRRRLDQVRRNRDADARIRTLETLADAVAEAEQRVARRRAAVPAIGYPDTLPIAAHVDEIAQAISDHQVVVVAGETGSGKTTQLPKICLQLGRGVRGQIGHTQPRRIAARTVAERIAEELDTTLGDVIGYEVRFDRRSADDTLVKIMTDGILLAGIQSDPGLAAYDTVILDEAHERSLNIDFLIGYLAQLLPRRPDLKLIITSATIDPQRFSRHFSDAPVVEVSGRTYPVEVRYRPLDERLDADENADEDGDVERDQTQGILDAVKEVCAEGPGDILVFLSGEREIRDTADALAELRLRDTEILPLYARLATAQQRRVFQPHSGRRIVLATNVAETSLTVPGVHYVIDPGYARISRYSTRRKVQRLPIEKISQASADQRKGRCGRTADGICIRLYSEDDYLVRPRFTEPEILRTSLASVLLQMAALRLGDVTDFPFLDPPDARQVRDGMQLLHELGAIDQPGTPGRRRRAGRRPPAPQRDQGPRRHPPGASGAELTPVGRTLARLPIDPRLGRMIIEADRTGCLHEILVIAAALSIPDPRQRPTDAQQAADARHARFADDTSDFLTWLNLWRYLREQRGQRSSSQFRKMCRVEFLHYLRVREWQDLYMQLRRVARDLGMRPGDTPAEPATIHYALLAGLLSHIGTKEGDRFEYLGARGARFAIQPGSVLFKQSPKWVMAAELVETSRLWARTVARIRPEWAERLGEHLVTRTYSEPHWDAKRGGVVAFEKVSLYGVPLVTSRKVDYGKIDPELSRELFIQHALVEGEWQTRHRFWHDNQRRIAEVEEVARKLRRRDISVDDETLVAFYDQRVGPDVVSTRHFDTWWRRTARQRPDLLDLPRELLLGDAAVEATQELFPDQWSQGDVTLALSYRFEPRTATDGVVAEVPVAVLNRLRAEDFEWQVPGLRTELVVELLRSLPKDLRRRLVPLPDTAAGVLSRIAPSDGALLAALERALQATKGVTVPRDAWHPADLPDHLRMTFRIVDTDGRTLAEGPDLAALQRRLAPQVQTTLSRASGIERSGQTAWTFGAVPRSFTGERQGTTVQGFPALVDEGDSVALRVLATPADQQTAMWAGTRRLLLLNAGSPIAQVHRRLDNATKLALATNPHGSVAALLDDAATSAMDDLLLRRGGPVWDADAFTDLLRAVRAELVNTLTDILVRTAPILVAAADVSARLSDIDAPALAPAAADMRAQLTGLVHPGFLTAKGARRLDDVARYVEGIQRRLDALARDPVRDRERMERVVQVLQVYRQRLRTLPPTRRDAAAVRRIPWMIEELRISEFAQALGTAYRVSAQRVLRAIDDLDE